MTDGSLSGDISCVLFREREDTETCRKQKQDGLVRYLRLRSCSVYIFESIVRAE